MSDLDLSKYEGHTEGEWRLDIGTGWIVASRGDRIQVQILVARMRPTCVTDQWEADAHLIADAPLLLAEVRRLRSLEAVCRTVHGGKLWVLADQVEALRHSHARLLEALQLVGRVEEPEARPTGAGARAGGGVMSSIDFIDEAGREWAHASRYRALEGENAALRKSQAADVAELRRADETIGALRKRVEELESDRLKGLRLAYELTPDCQTVEEAVAALLKIAADRRKRVEELESEREGVFEESRRNATLVGLLEARAEEAEQLLALSRDALLRYFQPGEVGEDVAPRIVEMQESLRERAEKAERELDYEQERNRLNVQQWSEENAKLQADLDARQQKWAEAVASLNVERLKNTGLQADLDALRATSAELDADRLRKHEELHRVKADLDAALNWIEHDEDESIPPAGLWQRVKALLEKRRVERG